MSFTFLCQYVSFTTSKHQMLDNYLRQGFVCFNSMTQSGHCVLSVSQSTFRPYVSFKNILWLQLLWLCDCPHLFFYILTAGRKQQSWGHCFFEVSLFCCLCFSWHGWYKWQSVSCSTTLVQTGIFQQLTLYGLTWNLVLTFMVWRDDEDYWLWWCSVSPFRATRWFTFLAFSEMSCHILDLLPWNFV